jgi:hypothetical protein
LVAKCAPNAVHRGAHTYLRSQMFRFCYRSDEGQEFVQSRPEPSSLRRSGLGVAEVYRKIAVRYVFMAEDVLRPISFPHASVDTDQIGGRHCGEN